VNDRVRPFVMTGGRVKADRRDLRVETLLQATGTAASARLTPEQEAIGGACARPRSLAEVGAECGLVLGVATVLAGDLIAEGLLQVHHTDPVEIELDALTRMLDRVREL
jgi:hypothetical protein